MKVDNFIDQIEGDIGARNPIVQEMHQFNENPESLEHGDVLPNFENMQPEMQTAMYHFYIGMIFGIGLNNKHDIDGTKL